MQTSQGKHEPPSILAIGSRQWHAEANRIWVEFVRANPPGDSAPAFGAVAPHLGRVWLGANTSVIWRQVKAECGRREHFKLFGYDAADDVLGRESRRLQVLSEIETAFDGVSREDGVTLHEAEVLDSYGGAAERAAARKLDTEARWNDAELAECRDVLSFLDNKGFRYYMPAYMCCELLFGDHNENLEFHLSVDRSGKLAAWTRARHDVFRPAEATAIHSFLVYARDDMGWEVSDESLAYWGRFKSGDQD